MKQLKAEVIETKEIADAIFSTRLKTEMAAEARPGQFIMINTHSGAHLLGRPISICDIDAANKTLGIVYRKVGYGTDELSRSKTADRYEITGPLGNGFPIHSAEGKEKILLIGGGIGAPPLLALAKRLPKEKIIAVLGYRSEKNGLFLKEEFEENCAGVIIATDDGTAGSKGTVIDAIKENGIDYDLIYSCGPMPMLSAVKKAAEEKNIKAYISLEERMACGVGACLGCVVKMRDIDEHSRVKNSRVCTEGPVYEAQEVMI